MITKKPRGRAESEKKLPTPQSDRSVIFEFPAVTIPPLQNRGEVETPQEISKLQDVKVRDLKPTLSLERTQASQSLATRVPAIRKLLGKKFVPIGVRTSADVKHKSTVIRAM